MDFATQSTIALGVFFSGACIFVGVLLGFITDEISRTEKNSGLVNFARTVAVVIVLIGLGTALAGILSAGGVFQW